MNYTDIEKELQELLQKSLSKVLKDTLSKRVVELMIPNTTIADGELVYTHPIKGRMNLEEAIVVHSLEESKAMGLNIK